MLENTANDLLYILSILEALSPFEGESAKGERGLRGRVQKNPSPVENTLNHSETYSRFSPFHIVEFTFTKSKFLELVNRGRCR